MQALRMTPDVVAAEERARLAAADLLAVATQLVALHSMRPEHAEDDVDFAVLSRRFTSYAETATLSEAREDQDFAKRARAEIESISASLGALPAAAGEDPVVAELIGRLDALAAECERRAVGLRS
jgi:hypothetical protein